MKDLPLTPGQSLAPASPTVSNQALPAFVSSPPPRPPVSPTASLGHAQGSATASRSLSGSPIPDAIPLIPFPRHELDHPKKLVKAYNSEKINGRYRALQRILSNYYNTGAPPLGALSAIVYFSKCRDKHIWERTLKITCDHLANSKLSNLDLCMALTNMLGFIIKNDSADANNNLTSRDMLGLLDILMPSVKGIATWINHSVYNDIVILNLLILIGNTMLNNGFRGTGLDHPILKPLAKIATNTGTRKAIVKHKAQYATNILAGLRSAEQIWHEKLAVYRSKFEAITHLFKAGVAIAAAVMCPATLLATAPDIIDNLSDGYRKFTGGSGNVRYYHDNSIPYAIEFLTLTSIALYTHEDMRLVDKYLRVVKRFIEDKENYHGFRIAIIKDIIDIVVNRLWILSRIPVGHFLFQSDLILKLFKILTTICDCCKQHFAKHRLRQNDDTYMEIKVYLLYNMHRLHSLALSDDMKSRALRLRNELRLDDKTEKEIELLAVSIASHETSYIAAQDEQLQDDWSNLTRDIQESELVY